MAIRAASLVVAAISIVAVERIVRNEHPIVRMLAIVVTLFLAMKLVVLAFERTALPIGATLAFLGWPGMRPELFQTKRAANPTRDLVTSGLRAFALGAALFVIARLLAASPIETGAKRVMVTVLALPALSLMLHFGFFDLVTAFYRRRGIPVAEVFRAPLRSRSLSEFWSRRWNVGFSEMIAIVVDRPLRRLLGSPTWALYGSFFVSGVLHELAISVPVRAGYGLPTVYFLLHGTLVAIERKLGRPLGRGWTIFWLVAPMPLLFHPWFVRDVIWPLVGLSPLVTNP